MSMVMDIRIVLLQIGQVYPTAGTDTALGRLVLCTVLLTYSLLGVLLVINRRRNRVRRPKPGQSSRSDTPESIAKNHP